MKVLKKYVLVKWVDLENSSFFKKHFEDGGWLKFKGNLHFVVLHTHIKEISAIVIMCCYLSAYAVYPRCCIC